MEELIKNLQTRLKKLEGAFRIFEKGLLGHTKVSDEFGIFDEVDHFSEVESSILSEILMEIVKDYDGRIGTLKNKIENSEEEIKSISENMEDLENQLDEKEKKIKNLKNRVKGFYGEIIQVVAVVVAIFTLIIGNLLGAYSFSSSIGFEHIFSILSFINGTILLGIFFLLILIRSLFFGIEEVSRIVWLLGLVPILFLSLGIYLL